MKHRETCQRHAKPTKEKRQTRKVARKKAGESGKTDKSFEAIGEKEETVEGEEDKDRGDESAESTGIPAIQSILPYSQLLRPNAKTWEGENVEKDEKELSKRKQRGRKGAEIKSLPFLGVEIAENV